VSGILAGLSMTNSLPADFKAFYFGFLNAHADPASGYFRCSPAWPDLCQPGGTLPPGENKSEVILVHDMSNYAHILWEYVWEGVRWPYPERVVDRGLSMQNNETGYFEWNSDGSFGDSMATEINCHQFDGVHTVARSSLLAGRYRWNDVRTMCERFLRTAAQWLNDGKLLHK
jgi:hypothetical protein